MKILKDLIKKADDTLEEIEWYAEKAMSLRSEYKAVADTYIKIGEMHVDIYKMLHDRMVALIDDKKREGVELPVGMVAIWEYEHEKLIKRFTETKYLMEEYKKMS